MEHNQSAPSLGDEVSYIRHHHKEGIIEGKALIRAWGTDGEKRSIALLQETERLSADGKYEVFNVPSRCVNPTKAFKAAFATLAAKVKNVETEANKAARAIVDEANTRIREMHDEVLGAPLTFKEAPDAPPAETPSDDKSPAINLDEAKIEGEA
jgi:hypothetical protein